MAARRVRRAAPPRPAGDGQGARAADAPDDRARYEDPERLLALDRALAILERKDPRKAQIVLLRFFAGMTIEQTAEALGVSKTTVKDEWHFARGWLFSQME